MKRTAVFIAACIVAYAASGTAKAQEADTTTIQKLTESVVTATVAPKGAPFAIQRIPERDLKEFSKGAQELPFLFARTPGVMAWGDNGLGTGTTYLRIRGAGDSRINITLDGVPLNSPEDQCVFWANMNSYSSYLGSAVIQRGIGSSSNGDGAFGGTVALVSKTPSFAPSAEFNLSYGSFNTIKIGATASSGLIHEKWIIENGYYGTVTDGYIHNTDGESGNWLFGITFLANKNVIIRYRNLGNYEYTGQAWNGVETGELLDGTYGAKTGIFGYADLWRIGLGRYNSLSEYYEQNADGSYKFVPYPQNTTDNFVQDHNILSASWRINDLWNASASLHYTYGEGYYSEFRSDNKLSKFGLSNFTLSDGSTLKRTDFVRKKGMYQNTYGAILNATRQSERLDLRLGLSAQNFSGNHFGYLTYIANEELRAALMKGGDYQYYDSDAVKTDISGFVKATLHLGEHFNAFGDLQYRYVRYYTDGYNDKFIDNNDGTYSKHILDIDETYNFFNPKAGLEFHGGIHNAFASVALGHREPERNNFTDNGDYPAPKAESMIDYELGYNIDGRAFQGGITLYYMDYKDQFVQTGLLSDIGEKLTTNVARSYRAGIEMSAAVRATRWLDFEANAALSRNRILDFDEYVEDWDDWKDNPDAAKYHCDGDGDEHRKFHYDNSTLAFSPAAILGGGFSLHARGARLDWHTGYVSKQYLDNTENDFRSLPAYSTTDVNLSYTLVPKADWMRDITFGIRCGNIFNARYASSAWVYSAIAESYGHTNGNRYTEMGFFPAAGFTLMGTLNIRF